MNGIVISAELKDVFAVRTAVTHEFLEQTAGQRSTLNAEVAIAASAISRGSHVMKLDDRADHAGAQSALLVRRGVEGHGWW